MVAIFLFTSGTTHSLPVFQSVGSPQRKILHCMFSSAILSFCDPDNLKAQFLIGLFSHRHPDNNQLHWPTENLFFRVGRKLKFLLNLHVLFLQSVSYVAVWKTCFFLISLYLCSCIFMHKRHSLAKITKFSIWGNRAWAACDTTGAITVKYKSLYEHRQPKLSMCHIIP